MIPVNIQKQEREGKKNVEKLNLLGCYGELLRLPAPLFSNHQGVDPRLYLPQVDRSVHGS